MNAGILQSCVALTLLGWQVVGGWSRAAEASACPTLMTCCCTEAPAPTPSEGSCCAAPEPASASHCPCPQIQPHAGDAEPAVASSGGSPASERPAVQALDDSVQTLDDAHLRALRPAWTAHGGAPPGHLPLWQAHRAILL